MALALSEQSIGWRGVELALQEICCIDRMGPVHGILISWLGFFSVKWPEDRPPQPLCMPESVRKPIDTALQHDLHALARDEFALVNQTILRQLHSDVELVREIGHYLIESGGKRLRPLVVLLAAGACQYRGSAHIDLAVVVEFLHTATLLHDDVVDMSQLRRGRTTVNARWGNAPSVLVGDFIYSRAFELMVKIGSLQIMQVLAETTNKLAEGEVMQLLNAGNPDVDETRYREVILRKTAKLFEASAQSAAILAGRPATEVEALASYGRHLGLAFQLIDDVLDFDGNSDLLGKNLGDDLAEGKPTLPLIITLERGAPADAALVRDTILNGSSNALNAVIDAVKRSGGLEYTRELARHEAESAIESLHVLAPSRHRDGLIRLARFAVERQY